MANKKRFLEAAAGRLFGLQTASAAIEDLFSTDLYTGNGSTQTITNGIDLAGEGGLVWIKPRNVSIVHQLFDTERGFGTTFAYRLISNDTNAQGELADGISAFNSDGFSLGNSAAINGSSYNYASWTFRKAPRFFDVVTYTGDGTNGRQIAHNLAHEVGCCIIKKTSASGDWWVYHRGASANSFGILNGANSFTTSSINSEFASEVFGDGNSFQAPTDTFIEVSSFASNENGTEYVAYLFAHDPLGPSGDGSDGLIACGSYTGNGNTDGPTVTLGWEPQWLMIRGTGGGDWQILDNMRGIHSGGTNDARLFANSSDAEYNSIEAVQLQATGFKIDGTTGGAFNGSGSTYIYIAIRRGPMRMPESGAEVFDVGLRNGSVSDANTNSNILTDASIILRRDSSSEYYSFQSRLSGNLTLQTNNTGAANTGLVRGWDTMSGLIVTGNNGAANSGSLVDYSFKRAPGFFDVVTYTGTGSNRTVNHNLGTAPELIICKKLGQTGDWPVYHAGMGASQFARLNTTGVFQTGSSYWNNTEPTASVFSLGTDSDHNNTGIDAIAYLFATLPGVSKVGIYVGNGSSKTINCGFTSGARFVLVKNASSFGSWNVYDSSRGIVAGDDTWLFLNDVGFERQNSDDIDPDVSGFVIEQTGQNLNAIGNFYIFLAIA